MEMRQDTASFIVHFTGNHGEDAAEASTTMHYQLIERAKVKCNLFKK